MLFLLAQVKFLYFLQISGNFKYNFINPMIKVVSCWEAHDYNEALD